MHPPSPVLFFLINFIYLFKFHITFQATVLLPTPPLASPLFPPQITLIYSSQRLRAPMLSQQSLAYQVGGGPSLSPFIKAE